VRRASVHHLQCRQAPPQHGLHAGRPDFSAMTPICAASLFVVSYMRRQPNHPISMWSQHVRIWDECLQYMCIFTDMRVAAALPLRVATLSFLVLSPLHLHLYLSSSPSSSSSAVALSESSDLVLDRPGSPRRLVLHHLITSVPVLFFPLVYSDNCVLHRHLLPRHCATTTVVEAFSAGPSDDSAWWCTLPSHIRYWQHQCVSSSPRHFRACLAHWLLTASTSALTPSSTASPRHHLRPWWFPLHSIILTTPPRASAASCAAPYPRQPQQLHVDHGNPTHDIIDNSYSPSSQLYQHRHKGLPTA
jgi:hypothetical protein